MIMMRAQVLCLLCMGSLAAAAAQPSRVPPQPNAQAPENEKKPTTRFVRPPVPAAVMPAAAPMDLSRAIDRPTLETMYRSELGQLYTAQNSARIYEAHLLIEKYFATRPAAEKHAVAQQIEAMKLEPAIIGRLTRIRLFWPQFQGGMYYVNERVGPHPVIYFMGVPKDYDRAKPWPLVIKLPGAHAFLTDPLPKADDIVRIYTAWIQDELKRHPDAVVLMPVLDLNELWGPSYKGMNSVYQPLLHVAGRLNIDPRRVYMRGHAMSGHATWNLALHYPTYFAAINPMSGGAPVSFQRIRLPNLRNILTVVWHDADDKIIPVKLSRELVTQLKKLKYDVDYEETTQVGSAPTEEIAERQYTKMRARTRELYPKEVSLDSDRPDTLFNRNDWVQVYQMLNPGKERRARLELGTGTLPLLENSYHVTAAITAPNRIQVTATNVESMRIYLNEQMVDLSKPVTVTFNGPVRFQGLVRPSIEEMLKDQVFLGRGWRYYTGAIDIDFGASAGPTTRPATPKGKIEILPE